MKEKIKKATYVNWSMYRYTGGQRHALSTIGVWADKATINRGQRSRLILSEIRTLTENGKDGTIVFSIKDFFGKSLTEEDVDRVILKVEPWMKRWQLNYGQTPNISGDFMVNVVLPNGSGFLETIISLVSTLSATLEVRSDDWFLKGFQIEQITYVLIKGKWLPLTEHLLLQYPIYDPEKSRQMNGIGVGE